MLVYFPEIVLITVNAAPSNRNTPLAGEVEANSKIYAKTQEQVTWISVTQSKILEHQ